MKLKTFNRYHFPERDISCGTVAVALATGKCPSEIKRRLENLRKKNKWSDAQRINNSQYMYWDEALHLVKALTKGTKTVQPRYSPPLEKVYKKFKRGETYLVCTTSHLQLVQDGLIYDTYNNSCLRPKQVKHHPWAKRKTNCYIRLTKKKN